MFAHFHTELNCSSIKTPRNGWKSTEELYVDTTVKFRCNYGYTPPGLIPLKCLANQSWNGTAPNCTGIQITIGNVNILSLVTLWIFRSYKALCKFTKSKKATLTVSFSNPMYSPDIDECLSNRHNCSVNGTCTNHGGGFSCKCNEAFTGDGISCTSKKWMNVSCLNVQKIKYWPRAQSTLVWSSRILFKCVLFGIPFIRFPAEMNCSSIGTPQAGWKSTEVSLVDTLVNFGCKFGYRISTTSPLKCLVNRTWNGTTPTCKGN